MQNLHGQMKKLYRTSVREDLKHFARAADESARKTEQYATALALELEELNRNADQCELLRDEVSRPYDTRENECGDKLVIRVDPCESGGFLSMAIGCKRVPITADVLRQLRTYQRAIPAMMQMYDEVENIDGVFLFDIRSNILLFRTEYMFADDFYHLAGTDMADIYDAGLTFYDWFKYVDREKNPDRRALWSPMAFVAVEHDWIMHLQAPFYQNRYSDDETMVGFIGIHYNLDWLHTNTIAKSAVRMMIVKDDSTLIAMNAPAKQDVPLETFDKCKYMGLNPFDPATTQRKKNFVYETLNLNYKSPDVASFSAELKSEFRFDHTLFGKRYTVFRERAPELGLNFVALLQAEG